MICIKNTGTLFARPVSRMIVGLAAIATLAACTREAANEPLFPAPLPLPQGAERDMFSPGELAQIDEILRLNEEVATVPSDLPPSGDAFYNGTGSAFILIGDGPTLGNGWYVGDVYADVDFSDSVPHVDGEISNLVLEDSGGLVLSGSILLRNGVLQGNRFEPALSGFLGGLNVDGSAYGVFVGSDGGHILGLVDGELEGNQHTLQGMFHAPRTGLIP